MKIIVRLILLFAVLLVPNVYAVTITWSGAAGNGNWFTTNNWSSNAVPGAGDDVVITNCPGTVVLTSSATIRSLVITGETLIFSNWNTTLAASDITLYNAATFTHPVNTSTVSPWTPNNGIFINCTNLTMLAGSSMNADCMGYGGGASGVNGYGPGGGGGSANRSGGAGYGGQGGAGGDTAGTGGSIYGAFTNPVLPGSGGGGAAGNRGGGGGGYVQIVASGTVTVDGVITMNGSNALIYTGGGSGGGIFIQCGSLAGGGTIRALGGNSGISDSGGGGGGRIAISAATVSNFGGQISAKGGTGLYAFPDLNRKSAAPGTIYLSDWGILPAVLSNGGAARVAAATGIVSSLMVSNYSLLLEWGWETNRLRAGTITVKNTGKIMHFWNTDTAAPWAEDGGIFIECSNLTVEAGGEINGQGLGFGGGAVNASGYGPGQGIYSGSRGGGGGYGGGGGRGDNAGSTAGSAYGVNTNPVNAGSGGSGGYDSGGGGGGGYAKIVAAGTVTVDGVINMNGLASGNIYSGGGSGGGLVIQCDTLAGSGTIQANGGNCVGTAGGGGGGGRIMVLATNASSFGGQLSAKSGTGYTNFPDADRLSAAPGTVYLSDWRLLPPALTNGGAARLAAPTGMAAAVTVSNYTLLLEWGWETNRLQAGTVTVKNTGKIMHGWNTDTAAPWAEDGGIFIECSNLTVEAGGEINGQGLGFGGGAVNVSGYGPGRGIYSGSRGGGGGYGGTGGVGSDASSYGGGTYGFSNTPANAGSGGSGGYNGGGGPGGGYVKIVASGPVLVDGTINMNGWASGGNYSGGGSGGGILIICSGILGKGTIRANGGSDGGAGGGGGGGRIALYVRGMPFYTGGNLLATPRPAGGSGYSYGGAGTLVLELSKPRGTVWSTW